MNGSIPYYSDRVGIGQITRAVTYLVNNAYRGHSSTSVSKYLKKHFVCHTYTNKMGMYCTFNANDIWMDFFLKNPLYKRILDHRRIDSMAELIQKSSCWC